MKIITLWAVHQGEDDRNSGYPEWYFDSESEANEVAKGKGWYGGNAPVREYSSIFINKKYYILQDKEPIELGLGNSVKINKLKKKALAKLTVEEREALGIE